MKASYFFFLSFSLVFFYSFEPFVAREKGKRHAIPADQMARYAITSSSSSFFFFNNNKNKQQRVKVRPPFFLIPGFFSCNLIYRVSSQCFCLQLMNPSRVLFHQLKFDARKFFITVQSITEQERWKRGLRCYPPHSSSSFRMRSVQKSSRAKFVRTAVAAFHLPPGPHTSGRERGGKRGL